MDKLKIWCLLRDQYALVKPIESYMEDQADFTYDPEWDPDKMIAQKPDLVLSVNEYHYDVARCIEAAHVNNIPSLVLQDGILEWRCQYENPLFTAGGGAPQHQPVLSDKIACIGAQSARQIAAWGNAYKVEVTGMPRLDGMLRMPFNPIRKPGNRLLVMTAKKPWFDDRQKEITLQSLMDVKDYVDHHPEIDVVWRLTKNVASMIGVENRLTELSTQELSAVLDTVDAVVSTISTAILEAMVSNRPVAALDYHNTPRFVQTAWTITSESQIPQIIDDLLHPPMNKIAYQDACLRDNLLLCDAASKVAKLIITMVDISRNFLDNDTNHLKFNSNLSAFTDFFPISSVSMVEIYPDHESLQNTEIITLQNLLSRANNENIRLKQQLKLRNLGYWLEATSKFIVREIFHK